MFPELLVLSVTLPRVKIIFEGFNTTRLFYFKKKCSDLADWTRYTPLSLYPPVCDYE